MKYLVQHISGMESSTPNIFVSVELFMLIFCLVDLTIENPRPKDDPRLEYSHILEWTANNGSTRHFKIPLPLTLRVSENMHVPLIYCIKWTRLAQSSSLGARTTVVKNEMAVQVYGLFHLVAYKFFMTRLWNSTTLF